MHWCIQENIYHERGMEELLTCLQRADLPHSLHKVIPFDGGFEPDLNVEGPVMCMGSYSMRHVAKRKGWWPGVFDLEFFDYEHQRRAWPGHMLNDDAIVCPFSHVPELMPAEEVFIRPIADSKVFAGAVMTRQELEPWVDSVCKLEEDYGDSLSKATLVMMCAPKAIRAEYRNWIVGGRVATSSLYKRGDRVLYSDDVDAAVIEYANARAAEHCPLEAFVMDVADTEEGFRIVECNTFNAAGLYAANVGRLVEAICALAQPQTLD